MAMHDIMCRLVIMLIFLTHVLSSPPCPGSDICYCSSRNKTKSVFCYGNNIRHTIYFEPLPDDVDKLHLEGFLFTNLSSETFPPSLNIKKVHFKENEIVYIHPDLFENWSDLEELSFSDNKVQNTTDLFIAIGVVLKQGTHNIQIALQGMRVGQLQDPEYISGNLSKILALKFSRNEFTSLNFSRLHIFSKLEMLKISENFIRTFDNFTVLPAIRYLDISRNRLDNPGLCPDGNNYFPNLTELILSRNVIRIFNSTWLNCLEKLSKLDLSYNNIQFFDISDIEQLDSLTDLNMQGNWLTVQHSLIDPFGRYPRRLQKIDLSRNEFVPFPPNMCPNASREKFTSVTHLDLSYNHIINLKNNQLYCFPNLVELRLSKNSISTISNGSFAAFGNLKHLYIDSQLRGIQAFEASALNLARLNKLDIKGNFLNFDRSDLRELFHCCPNLKELNISDNYIGEMNETMLAKILEPLTKLERLVMKRFGLRNFPIDVVKKLKHLRELIIDKKHVNVITRHLR